MPLFGPSHISVLILIVVTTALLCWLGRSQSRNSLPKYVGWILAVILICNKLVTLIYTINHQSLTWETGLPMWLLQNALPMHLCDWACFTAVIAFVTRNQTAYELTYFWGLAGTLQAVLTPDLSFDFPDLRFITFFISHGGIIVALLYLTLGLGMRPTWKSIVRVVLWGQIYLLSVGIVDWLAGANYGYLCAKPVHASLMDHFGPWPWYIITLEVLAMVFYTVYYLPFAIYDFQRKRRNASEMVAPL